MGFIIAGIILGIIILALIIVYICLSNFCAEKIASWSMYPNFDTREARKAKNAKDGNSAGTENWERKEFVVTMSDGYEIHGDTTINDPKKVVLLLHGHGSTREGVVKYARVFYELGYSVVMYDHRGHGDNVRTYSTFGYQEGKDAAEVFRYVQKEFGKDAEIGVFGVSMGGASAILMTQYTQEMDFIVVDCAYAGADTVIYQICKDHHLPKSLPYAFANAKLKKRAKYDLKYIKVRDVAAKLNVPILDIHGTKDSKIWFCNQDTILKNVKSFNDRLAVEGAEHGQSVNVDPVGYRKKVKEFIENVHKLNKERD